MLQTVVPQNKNINKTTVSTDYHKLDGRKMSVTETALKLTPLNTIHQTLKARMVAFGGWQMPLQYEGILAEYEYTRRGCTVFDTSHMGEFLIEGDCVQSGLDNIVTSAIKDMPEKTCRYGLALNDQGGVIDDLIVYRIAKEQWMIVVNAGTMESDAAHFHSRLKNSAKFTNISHLTGKLDIQGPLSRDVLKNLVKGIEKLEYYGFDDFDVLGQKVIVSRTGYTGELGYEIYFPWDKTEKLWNEIFKNPQVKPAGLGVRDVLRIEMGYSLCGHEIDETISPLAAGLSKFVDFDKDFIGKAALLKEKASGIQRKQVCFSSLSRRSPRAHHKILSENKEEIGVVTSGTFSPSLNIGIGLGFVDSAHAQKDQKIWFGVEDGLIEGVITTKPFYKNGSLKS